MGRRRDVVATPGVIPAKAGIQGNRRTAGQVWIPAYAAMTPMNDAANQGSAQGTEGRSQ